MEKEVSFFLNAGKKITLDVGAGSTCSAVIQELLECLRVPASERGAWQLTETWRGCERRVGPHEQLLPLCEGWGEKGGQKLCLRQKKDCWKQFHRARKPKRERLGSHYSQEGKMTYKKLHRLQRDLKRALLLKKRECSSVLLSRLVCGDPLWGPREPGLLDVMRYELSTLREQNLQLSTEISDLNITATRLGSQKSPLQEQVATLTGRLSRLQEEVSEGRREWEKRRAKEEADTQTQLLKLKRELDVRNRLNASQNTKMQTQKEELARKRQILAEKERELERLKNHQQWKQQLPSHKHEASVDHHLSSPEQQMAVTSESRDSNSFVSIVKVPPSTKEDPKEAVTHIATRAQKTPPRSHARNTGATEKESISATPQSTPHKSRDRSTPSTSKKRHFSIFEAKTKQLVEEEGQAFRASQRNQQDNLVGEESGERLSSESSLYVTRRLDFSTKESGEDLQPVFSPKDRAQKRPRDPKTRVYGGLTIPKADEQWYKEKEGISDVSYRSKILGDTVSRKRERMSHVREDRASSEQWSSMTGGFLDEVMSSFEQKQSSDGISQELSVSAQPQSVVAERGGGKLPPRSSTKKPEFEIRRKSPRWKKSKGGPGKKVHFPADAVILNAALEGDLDLLKDCIRELGSCAHTSDKGATCLHNAICSGSFPPVQYLVEMGCDVNAQDVDGWTPLHCAVAYSNLEMLQYLLENGASLFLEAREGETPLRIGMEEYRLQQEAQGYTNPATEECLKCLMDAQNSLGVSNDATVFALFSYQASDSQELSFQQGDMLKILERGDHGNHYSWWLAENARGERGLVPCTYLGANGRYLVIL